MRVIRFPQLRARTRIERMRVPERRIHTGNRHGHPRESQSIRGCPEYRPPLHSSPSGRARPPRECHRGSVSRMRTSGWRPHAPTTRTKTRRAKERKEKKRAGAAIRAKPARCGACAISITSPDAARRRPFTPSPPATAASATATARTASARKRGTVHPANYRHRHRHRTAPPPDRVAGGKDGGHAAEKRTDQKKAEEERREEAEIEETRDAGDEG
ncbi:hypothetical protein FB451DRAFT_1378498 [Mycena latifolia]|nr:hypothetical protein FB451DRAFT_1378498 [Mycena latifolia]